MSGVRIALLVVLVVTSLFLTLLILMHKGRGGGLSDMFGGGLSGGAASSGMAERNLNRITVAAGVIWALTVVLLQFLERFAPAVSGN